jgi:Domain of unknown function (DUF4136)
MLRCNHQYVLGICLALLLSACTGMSGAPVATTNYDHTYNFSNLHKIAIQPIAKDTLSTMLMSDAQIARIRQALSDELLRRGFQVVTVNAEADIFLSWKFVPKESYDVSTFDPANQRITQGMLYVNMIDPIMLQSVWRATFHADLREQPNTPEAAQYRQEAARAILADFPPEPATN